MGIGRASLLVVSCLVLGSCSGLDLRGPHDPGFLKKMLAKEEEPFGEEPDYLVDSLKMARQSYYTKRMIACRNDLLLLPDIVGGSMSVAYAHGCQAISEQECVRPEAALYFSLQASRVLDDHLLAQQDYLLTKKSEEEQYRYKVIPRSPRVFFAGISN